MYPCGSYCESLYNLILNPLTGSMGQPQWNGLSQAVAKPEIVVEAVSDISTGGAVHGPYIDLMIN